jgi:hypothetical protein
VLKTGTLQLAGLSQQGPVHRRRRRRDGELRGARGSARITSQGEKGTLVISHL